MSFSPESSGPKRAYTPQGALSEGGGSIHQHGGFRARSSRRLSDSEVGDEVCTARDLLAPLRRAVELHLRGDFTGAEQRLRAVLERAPELPQAHHHLAVVLHGQGRAAESVQHLKHAIALDPHLPGAEERLVRYVSGLG